ncbi:MAG: NAD(P)/FAD-dependent oxidoreductase [Cyanobacteria bacterium P01_C01_bin.72]
MSKRVLIIGAGPSGLLLAHYLLARQQKYQVDIYERRNDPRTISISRSRTFPVALNDRGMNALKGIPGLKEAVIDVSVQMRGSVIHEPNGKQRKILRAKPLYTLDRTELTKVLLDSLEQRYSCNEHQQSQNRLNIYFQHSCTQIDLKRNQATFSRLDSAESESTVTYDLIIGADGAKSTVRKHFLDTELFELEQKYIDNDYKSIHLPSTVSEKFQIALERDCIHSWRLDDGSVILLLYQSDGKMSGVIHFPRDKSQVTELKTAAEVKQFFEQNAPAVGQLMNESEAAAFLDKPVANVLTIKCNRYHYHDSALLIGDAAHAVSPSLGQGCNSALEDAVIFNRLLDEYQDNLQSALEQFTASRLTDARAVVELSNYTLPLAKSLFVEFILRQRIAKIMHRLFPQRFFPPLFDALYESSIPYGKIGEKYQGWCSRVKKSSVADYS